MAIQQNSLITEVIYAEHDEIERKALEALINLGIKYAYKDGGDFDYETDNLGMESFRIPPQAFDDLDIQINIANNTLDEQKVKELKQFAIKEYDKGILPFKDFLGLYDADTLSSMRKKFEIYTSEAFEVAQANAENAANIEIQKEKQLMDAQAGIDSQLKQMDSQLKQMEMNLKSEMDKMKNTISMEKIRADVDMNKENNQIKMMEIENENIMEQAYLNEQTRSNTVDQRLRAIELKMQAILKNSEISVKDKQGGSQKGTKAPEHISDR
jgi:hypothetical protein